MVKHFVLLAAAVLWGSLSVAARIITVQGHGNDLGFCSYTQASYCISTVKAGAEREAKRQAQWSCDLNRGRSQPYTAYCVSSCFPNMLNPGEESVVIRCSGDCRMQCELDN